MWVVSFFTTINSREARLVVIYTSQGIVLLVKYVIILSEDDNKEIRAALVKGRTDYVGNGFNI